MNETLNLSALTPQRQALLIQALGGHSVTFQSGALAPDSRKSLEIVGLTPLEIGALEAANSGRPGALIPTVSAATDPNNPWTQAGFNLTRQAEIIGRDPVLAERLRAQAGVA
ncbi:MAG: hypothetical protein EPN21_07055 [Methylococcaceae bacterium]|nr:MAG: hypothetical protein EPN21_07055 [Methylococcaceae bacterium]